MKRFFPLFIFHLITISSFANIYLHSPSNKSQISEDFYFICIFDSPNPTLTLEISNSETFNEIIFSNSSRWYTVDNCKQMPISPQELGNGTFYWRVFDGTTYIGPWSFTIIGQEETSNDYRIIRDKEEYPIQQIHGSSEPLVLSSLWIRSENTNNGLNQPNDGDFNFGIALKDDIIYIGHEDNITKTPYLNRYNANTGESLESIPIDYSIHSKPQELLKDLRTDDYGNIYTTSQGNFTLSSCNDIYIDVIDVSPESTTAKIIKRYICKLKTASELGISPNTIKFTGLIGNVYTGNFNAYCAINTTTSDNQYVYKILNWKFTSDSPVSTSSNEIFATTTTTDKETRIYPLNVEDYIYIVDNEDIYPTIYKKRTNKKDLSKETSFALSTDKSGNGLHIFKHGDATMMLYACNFKTEGSKFELITLSPNFMNGGNSQVEDFSGIKSLWKFPNSYLGNTTPKNSSTLATSQSEISTDGSPITKLYIYSSGNGLAAYKIAHYKTSKIDNNITSKIGWTINNKNLHFSTLCKNVTIYTPLGNPISKFHNISNINLTNFRGVYIVNADNFTFKIVLK